jgi:L-threonylcarbamoyladenylate synthase
MDTKWKNRDEAVRRIVVDATTFSGQALDEAVRVIRDGGVIALPTDTLYGLGADPFRPDAVARVFAIKGRSAERALPLIAADADQVAERFGPLPALACRLASRFWPGPLTLLLAAPAALAAGVSGGDGTVGIRIPSHAVARALCRGCGSPLTATSANMSGVAPSADPREVERTLGDRLDLLVDAGTTAGGPPSTIVDAIGASPRLVREGAISWSEIQAWLEA